MFVGALLKKWLSEQEINLFTMLVKPPTKTPIELDNLLMFRAPTERTAVKAQRRIIVNLVAVVLGTQTGEGTGSNHFHTLMFSPADLLDSYGVGINVSR